MTESAEVPEEPEAPEAVEPTDEHAGRELPEATSELDVTLLPYGSI